MGIIQDSDKFIIKQKLEEMESDVSIINFTQELECSYCRETRQMLEEVGGLNNRLTVQVYNFQTDKAKAEKYNIDKIPATVIKNDKDYGIRYYGIPSGYEFVSVLEDIIMLSKGNSGLSDQTRKLLQQVKKPVHIQVFVTPTCPYCPSAVRLAHQLAMESEFITADMIEATEFPHLAQKYGVMGVPKTVINEKDSIEGAAPEAMFVQKIMESIK